MNVYPIGLIFCVDGDGRVRVNFVVVETLLEVTHNLSWLQDLLHWLTLETNRKPNTFTL